MTKIARILNRLNIGGPVYNAVFLSKYLPAPYETKLIAGARDEHEGDASYIATQEGIVPTIVQSMRRSIHPWHDWRAYQETKRLLQAYQPDIVHTHAAKAGSIGRLAARALQGKRPILVHTFHGHAFHSYFSPAKTKAFIAIERYLAQRSDAIVTVSNLLKEELVHTYRICPADKVHVIHNGFDLLPFGQDLENKRNAFRTQWRIAESEIAIGIVGRLTAIKNQALFIEALSVLNKQQHSQPIVGVIIGGGEDEAKLKALCAQHGLLGPQQGGQVRILFTSWVTDMRPAYAGLDIVALTSKNEGMPVTLIEAMAAGLPVASTAVGGVADVVHDGQSGMLTSQDALDIAAKLGAMIENAGLRKQYGQAGQKFVLQHFTYQRLVRDMHALYQGLLDKR